MLDIDEVGEKFVPHPFSPLDFRFRFRFHKKSARTQVMVVKVNIAQKHIEQIPNKQHIRIYKKHSMQTS